MNERELLSELNQLINVLQELVAEQKEMNRYLKEISESLHFFADSKKE